MGFVTNFMNYFVTSWNTLLLHRLRPYILFIEQKSSNHINKKLEEES